MPGVNWVSKFARSIQAVWRRASRDLCCISRGWAGLGAVGSCRRRWIISLKMYNGVTFSGLLGGEENPKLASSLGIDPGGIDFFHLANYLKWRIVHFQGKHKHSQLEWKARLQGNKRNPIIKTMCLKKVRECIGPANFWPLRVTESAFENDIKAFFYKGRLERLRC